jgi:NADH-quinone oxidoreductase subunit N
MSVELPTVGLDFIFASAPILLLCLMGCSFMLTSVIEPVKDNKNFHFALLILTLISGLALSVGSVPRFEKSYLNDAYISGPLSAFGQSMVLVIALVTTIFLKEASGRLNFFRGEVLSLFSFCLAGMMILLSSTDAITIFIGLEISSICLYVLVGYIEPSRKSQEGAIKYFVLGSFGAALFLMGFALIYSATGTFNLQEMFVLLPKLDDHNWVDLGAILILCGLGLKLALVPFHLWTPDVYESAPTAITGFMATSVKVTMMVFAFRLLSQGLSSLLDVWLPGIVFLAASSVIVGNIMALVQSSLKRMLAYSSIAHGGYMSMALCALGNNGYTPPIAAIMYYLVVYTIVSLSAFGIIMWLEGDMDNVMIEDIRGLATKYPFASFCLASSMFALAGMPPTGGFIGKFFVFKSALDQQLYPLIIMGALGSTISLFYYLRVIVKIYLSKPSGSLQTFNPPKSFAMNLIMCLFIGSMILLGTLFPEPILNQFIKIAENVNLNG